MNYWSKWDGNPDALTGAPRAPRHALEEHCPYCEGYGYRPRRRDEPTGPDPAVRLRLVRRRRPAADPDVEVNLTAGVSHLLPRDRDRKTPMADAAQLTALPRIALKSIQHELAAEEMHVLSLPQSKTYDEIAQETGWSRGRIYALALKTGARKTEARIRERAKERQTRQLETLAEMINQPVKVDVSDYLELLPSGCARLICTSIPYNVGKSYGDAACVHRMKHIAYLGWLL